MRFKKPCIRCNKLFQPKGKYCKICDKCKKKKGWTKERKDLHAETIRHLAIIRASKPHRANLSEEKEKSV